MLDAGYHVQVQKPLARDLEGADRMLAARRDAGATLRVLEDYLFFPPLVKMKELLDAGEVGDPLSVHMKIVATGRGGWDLTRESLEWQFEQSRDGRGMLVFDHGWHQLAVATWLFGPIRRVFAWLGSTEIMPGIEMDAPSTLVWEHDNGVRAVLDITFAIDMYFRSSHYTGDERIEVTGTRGLRAHQPHQRAGDPGARGGDVPRRRDPRVPRPRRPPSRRVPRLDRARARVLPRRGGRSGDGAGRRAGTCSAALVAALDSHRLGHAVDVRDRV